MISIQQYFQKPHTPEQATAATDLLARVEALREGAERNGVKRFDDPDTGCGISGIQGGDGDGGFRTPASQTGAKGSPHREARGVDVFDLGDKLDTWLDTFDTPDGGNEKLAMYGLWREAAAATPGWCHLQSRPASRRTFAP